MCITHTIKMIKVWYCSQYLLHYPFSNKEECPISYISSPLLKQHGTNNKFHLACIKYFGTHESLLDIINNMINMVCL